MDSLQPVLSESFISQSEQETHGLGRRIGDYILRHSEHPTWRAGLLIGLTGTLGSGKTRLTQGIVAGLGAETQVTSPTFTLCVPYQGALPLLHLDAYRINALDEVDELGLDEQLAHGVTLVVEWVERIQQVLPQVELAIEIKPTQEDHRHFLIKSYSKRASQLVNNLTQEFNTLQEDNDT